MKRALLLGSVLAACGGEAAGDPGGGTGGTTTPSGGSGGTSSGGDGGGPGEAGGSGGTVPGGDVRARPGVVSAGDQFTCAIDVSRRARCWGSQYDPDRAPTVDFMLVAAGVNSVCGLDDTGAVVCWERSNLGAGDVTSNIPSGSFEQVAVGGIDGREFACAVSAQGDVECWRSSLFPDDPALLVPPAEIQGQTRKVALGSAHACALTLDGAVACWGGTTQAALLSPPNGEFVDLACSERFACAVDAGGTPTCWGNITHALADEFPSGAQAVSMSGAPSSDAMCALLTDGGAWCARATNPLVSPAEAQFVALAPGNHHVCGVESNGQVRCWTDAVPENPDVLEPPADLNVWLGVQ